MIKYRVLCSLLACGLIVACDEQGNDSSPSTRLSYDFTVETFNTIRSLTQNNKPVILANNNSDSDKVSSRANTFCDSVFCVTPKAVSGKYYGIGLLIQSNGNGMMSTFGREEWGSITGASSSFDFSLDVPIKNMGNLYCCSGTGDLKSLNTYISNVSYLMAYIDITIELTDQMGVHGSAVGTHNIRFVLADDAVPGASRGDILYQDVGDQFKWVSSADGSYSIARPQSPVTMDSAVVNYINPFGAGGNQTIPVIYAGIASADSSGGLLAVTEDDLKKTAATYEFYFNPSNLVIFPALIKNQDEGLLDSVVKMLKKIHLQGLPYAGQGMQIGLTPSAPDTTLKIEVQ